MHIQRKSINITEAGAFLVIFEKPEPFKAHYFWMVEYWLLVAELIGAIDGKKLKFGIRKIPRLVFKLMMPRRRSLITATNYRARNIFLKKIILFKFVTELNWPELRHDGFGHYAFIIPQCWINFPVIFSKKLRNFVSILGGLMYDLIKITVKTH